MTNQLVSIPVPGTGEQLQAVQFDGKEWAALRPICDAIGIDSKAQRRKLHSKPWAVGVMMTSTGSDGKNYEMFMVDRRTLTMWLATIDTNRVADEARPVLEAFQNEAADALDKYFNEGGVINPRADEHQVNALIFQARAQLELCQAAKGLIHDDHLEAQARIVLARGLGEVPVLNPATKPLYVVDYLKEKNLSTKRCKSVSPMFGKRAKKAYIEKHGREPQKYPLTLGNGQVREVYGYTEADRPLLDQVWAEYYAPATV